MKNRILGFLITMFLVCLFGLADTQSLSAQSQASGQRLSSTTEVIPTLPVPRLIKFSGVVQDASGQPRTGVVGITFAIYAGQSGGAALWLETQNAELDAQGRYSILLGSTKSEGVPLELFLAGESRWLGAQVQ